MSHSENVYLYRGEIEFLWCFSTLKQLTVNNFAKYFVRPLLKMYLFALIENLDTLKQIYTFKWVTTNSG